MCQISTLPSQKFVLYNIPTLQILILFVMNDDTNGNVQEASPFPVLLSRETWRVPVRRYQDAGRRDARRLDRVNFTPQTN